MRHAPLLENLQNVLHGDAIAGLGTHKSIPGGVLVHHEVLKCFGVKNGMHISMYAVLSSIILFGFILIR